jgi:hypothetical protein
MLRLSGVPGSFPPSRRRVCWVCQTPRALSSPARRVVFGCCGVFDWTGQVSRGPAVAVFADATGARTSKGETCAAVPFPGTFARRLPDQAVLTIKGLW